MNESLIDWIKKTPPAWSHNVIRDMEQDYPERSEGMPGVRQFVYLTENAYRDIDPDTIVGQWNHSAGQTWLKAVFEPNRKPGSIKTCLNLADSNPSYYFNNLKAIQLTSFDGENWYSHSGGNHRTIIGKFVIAKAEAKTGVKHNFLGVSTLRYHIDHECLDMYQKLDILIKENGLKITLDALSEPRKVLSNEFEIKISVQDNRKGINIARFGWLSAREFCKFARWVLKHDGKFPISYQIKDFFGLVPGFEQRRLIYPGMSGQYLSPPATMLRS